MFCGNRTGKANSTPDVPLTSTHQDPMGDPIISSFSSLFLSSTAAKYPAGASEGRSAVLIPRPGHINTQH